MSTDALLRPAHVDVYVLRGARVRILLLLMSAFAYLILATGMVLPRQIGSIPFFVHTAFYTLLFLYVARSHVVSAAIVKTLAILLPYSVALVLSAIWTTDPFYALEKVEGGIIATALGAAVWAYLLAKFGERKLLFGFAYISLCVLGLTVAYKAALGLNERAVRFFINGPIVFAWLMGFNALICLYLYLSGVRRYTVACWGIAFIMAVVWTESKGPVLALVLGALTAVFFTRGLRAVILAVVLISGFATLAYAILPHEYTFRFAMLGRMVVGDPEMTADDVSSARIAALRLSLSLIHDNLLTGVGLGNWPAYSDLSMGASNLTYPHNLILETASESGLFVTIILLMTLGYLFIVGSTFVRILMVFFFGCMSFSGDISYLRLLLSYPIAYAGVNFPIKSKKAPS